MKLGAALALAAVALGAAVAGTYFALSESEAPVKSRAPFARVTSKAVPELHFEDGRGQPRSLADFRGKLVVLNLWATWCAPCREEMPALDRLQAKLGGPRFEVVALSVDQQGIAAARKFFDEVGVKSLTLYIDPSAQASFKLGAVGLPSTLLVDAGGREIGRHIGKADWDSAAVVADLRRRIDAQAH